MNFDSTVAAAALLAASLLSIGCNSDSPGAGSPDGGLPDGGGPDGGVPLTEADIAGLEGVYRLESFTRNPDGCDAEGDDVLDALGVSYGYAKPLEEGPSPELLLFRSCSATTAEDCAAEGAAAGLETPALLTWGFGRAEQGVLIEESTRVGQVEMMMCTMGGVVDARMTSDGMSLITIEDRLSEAPPYPTNELGGCDGDPIEEIGDSLSCTQLSVLSATRVGDL